MWDRQYVSSLVMSAAVLALALAGIVSLSLWLGWGGVAAIVAIAGSFLGWFYGGSRPDSTQRERATGVKRTDDE